MLIKRDIPCIADPCGEYRLHLLREHKAAADVGKSLARLARQGVDGEQFLSQSALARTVEGHSGLAAARAALDGQMVLVPLVRQHKAPAVRHIVEAALHVRHRAVDAVLLPDNVILQLALAVKALQGTRLRRFGHAVAVFIARADAKKARELGAEGIGLCRTEHMFFEEDRIAAFREMICSDTVEEREAALDKILPYQQGDFEKLYEALEGNPVTIRFLDPPLHEFVPTEEADIKKLADAQGKSVEDIKTIINSLHEFNPMMGHRGCRLAVTYPEIAKMQTKAVIRAAINVQKAHPDWTVKPEIMIPLVCEIKELKYVKKVVVETADAEIAAADAKLEYEVGTMIEIPRAALTADEIATEADFFCFGTNDLTQMTFGFSRDDAGKFLDAYYDAKIFENDPFAKLDQTGVGKLMEMAIKLGKPVNPKLHVGICGEHGGDPSSVEFCHKIGLDYVSCSPFRVPIARLAAAQAAIAEG